ncbi:hypothetical protein [Neisseria wadsworthii]|uniref:Uncharacterized protein n=1 Tax=Neisseria wadsworthii 9715 TaxID=1030841 RepID=G4CM19_9NEIS|nr:hypothetical protein [Neisseria wadsworthii]EGZ51245.1 hypothetical protein HMPREF9370_0128 [Neisseria wadsworthii 9715]QMT36191.1 hypothetical protein H3L96_02820 [Neisseria wadsworthii]
MPPEKIYYAVIILISAISILLSPFFYVQTKKRIKTRHEIKNDWKIIAISSVIMFIVLLLIWLVWLA